MRNQTIKKTGFLFLLVVSIGLLACKQQNKMKEYNYGVSATCAAGYDINLHTGVFKASDGEIIPIISQHLSPQWGANGNNDAIGDGFDPLPDKLRLGFYSDAEDKFFEGEFDLPLEQMQKLFEEEDDCPFWTGKTFNDEQSGRTLKYMKYDGLSVCITLGGQVNVWITGTESRQKKEIAHFVAKEAPNVKWRDVYEYGTREESVIYNMEKIFTPRVKNQVLTKTLPVDLWDCYRKKYNWRYVFEFPDGGKLDEIFTDYLNAEADYVYNNNSKLNNDVHKMRALPFNNTIEILNGKGEKYTAWIVTTESLQYLKHIYKSGEGDKYPDDYREEELYKIFQTLDSSKPIDIIYKITPDYENIKIVIKQGDKEIPYDKVTQWLMKNEKK